MRTITWASSLLFTAALLAACGGNGGGSGDKGSAAAASCDGIDKLDSYRYSITIKLQSPAFRNTTQASPQPPLSAFADTLSALLSDFEIEGAHVAPDRTQAILRFKGDEVELRAIGDKRWERLGGAWREEEAASPEIGFLTPKVVCKDIVEEIAPNLAEAGARRETVNGVESDHYTLSKTDIRQLPDLLGTDPKTKLPEQFQVDVWLARETRWPVSLKIEAEDKDEQGNPVSVKLYMELRDVNDRGISIEAPPVAPPTG